MAIRIGPPPALARLRLYWHTMHSQYMRNTRVFREATTTTYERTLQRWRQASEEVAARLNPRIRAQVRRKAALASFIERYEELVDLLCWAAKDGVHTDRDMRYTALRDWMQRNYHKVRPLLRPHLSEWEGPFDPFEELFAPENIDAIINDISGIQYVMQTREALDACKHREKGKGEREK